MSRTRKTTKHYQRITIIVDADKANDIRNEYYKKGYRIISSGPQIIKWPVCNPDRMRFVFEKEIDIKEWREMLLAI